MKEDFKSIPRNQESSNLDLILGRNRNSKWRDFSQYTPPNLDFKSSVGAEMEEEHDGIERNERESF